MQLGVGELQMPSFRQRKESIARRGIETARRAAQLLGMQLPVPGATQEDSSILGNPLPQAVLSPTERLQVVNGSNGVAQFVRSCSMPLEIRALSFSSAGC